MAGQGSLPYFLHPNEDFPVCGEAVGRGHCPPMFFRGKVVLVVGYSFDTTLTGSPICSYGEAFGAGAVIGSYGIVAGMRAGVPSCAFIFI
jgi:Na+-translocating ferredoxin:NAD+ oxidoreductase RnfG subunit